MSEAFQSIQRGLEEAIGLAQGQTTGAIVHEFAPLDIKAVRAKVGMTQAEFATTFGISLGTLRHWGNAATGNHRDLLRSRVLWRKSQRQFCGH